MIDLHIHSTASDGSFTPLEILSLSRDKGLEAISLTDHDTIEGIREIHEHLQRFPLEFISGVELSCTPPEEFKRAGSVHMLGYGFSIYDTQLNHLLEKAKVSREQRNSKIINALNNIGVHISLKEVEDRFGAEQTGRPHIAELLKEKGVVDSFDQAFKLYLGQGKPGYVDKYKVSCETAIQVITEAGGVPVLAHPGLLRLDTDSELDAFVRKLAGYGLQGIEVFYTDHDPERTAFFKSLAEQNKLLTTGGSDFHGTFNAGVELGTGKGNLDIGFGLFQALARRAASIRALHVRLDILETHLGYRFIDRPLLENALCHRSYLNENQKTCSSDNERLEFLGDAVLGLCVGHILMKSNPDKKEGDLSKLRSSLVSEPALADMARKIDLGRFVRLGKGEAVSGGADKDSILSDAFEALIAAVYLDSGFERTFELVQGLFSPCIETAESGLQITDYKSALQEYAQEAWSVTPSYTLSGEMGPDHDKIFEISLELPHIRSTGFGKTKKAAEQESARNALEQIYNERDQSA